MTGILRSMKFSANIPDDLLGFLDQQVTSGAYKSRSQALTEALHGWRARRMEEDYATAFDEADDAWDSAAADGIDNQDVP
jgi:Arc/MetJ-type ribon-helix-helix transcriptional regulator